MLAAYNNQPEMVRLLLDNGANTKLVSSVFSFFVPCSLYLALGVDFFFFFPFISSEEKRP